MAEDRIDEYIDRAGVRGDTDFMLAALREVYAEFKKLEAVKISMPNVSGLSGLGSVTQQARTGLDSMAVAAEAVEQRMAAMNGKSKEYTQVLLTQIKAQNEAAKAAYNEAKAANESAKAKREAVKATNDANKARQQEKKMMDEAINDYLQLSKAYNEAALKAKNYVIRLGENHPIAVQAVKDANDLGNVLKKVDASVGQFQRNVGNYKSAFDGLGMSFAQVSRELPSLSISFQQFALAISNNLPMVADELKKAKLEIAALKAEGKDAPSLFSRIGGSILSWQVGLSVAITLFTVYAGKITSFFSSLFSGSKAISDYRRQQELLNTAVKEGNRNAGADIANLQVLYKVATDATIPIRDRKKAVDELQSQYPEYFKNIKDEIILQGKAKDAYNATKDAIVESAKARAIQSKLDALAAEELDLQQEQIDLTNKQSKATAALGKQRQKAIEEGFQVKGLAASGGEQTAILRQIQAEDKAIKDQVKINKDSQDRIAKDREFLLGKIKKIPSVTGGGTGGSTDDAKKEEEKRIRLLAEIQAIELQRRIDFNKEVAANEKVSIFDRYAALVDANQAELELIDLRYQTEKKIGKKTKEELEKLDAEKYDKSLRAELEFSKAVEALINERADKMDAYEKRVTEAARKGIEKRMQDFKKNLDEMNKIREQKEKEARDKEEEIERKKFELQKQLATELVNLSFTLFTANIERQKNAIQEQINALDERKAKEIEIANQTIVNEQQKAAAIAVIEARANAQREEYQRRQKELDIKKARFDKAQAIARIIQETAIQLIKGALTPGLAVLVAAIGAAQLAAVIAQPIPKYKHGKNVDNYEGPAIVGDGGKREAIIREDGSVQITDNKPQLTYVKKRDIVLPDANMLVNAVLTGHMGGMVRDNGKPVTDHMTASAVKNMEKNVVKAIKSIPQPVIKTEGIISKRIIHGDSSNNYLNRNLQS